MFAKPEFIEYGKRIGASKVRLFKDAMRTIQFIVQAILYYNPLKIFILMSALCMVGAAFCLRKESRPAASTYCAVVELPFRSRRVKAES